MKKQTWSSRIFQEKSVTLASSTENQSQTCFTYICMIKHHLQVSETCKYQTNPFVTIVSVREYWKITFVSLSIPVELSSAQFPLAIVWLVLGLKPPALPPIWKTAFQLRCLMTACYFLLLCNTSVLLCCFSRNLLRVLHSTSRVIYCSSSDMRNMRGYTC